MSITEGHCRGTPAGLLVTGSCDYYYFHSDTQRESLRRREFSSHVKETFSSSDLKTSEAFVILRMLFKLFLVTSRKFHRCVIGINAQNL